MTKPKVSIIMPSRNKAKFIKKTIDSVLNQDLHDFELIVIDNCSKDGSQKIVQEIAHKDKRVRLLENEKDGGIVYSLNRGLEEAKGDFIAVLHCDDIWQENFLSSSISALEANKGAGICFCNYKNIDENDAPHKILARNRLNGGGRLIKSDELFTMLLERDFMPVCTVMVTREAHEKCGDYDPQFPGPSDYQMWLKIASRMDGVYNSESTSQYRIYGENDTTWIIDNNISYMEQYSMIRKLFAFYIPKSEKMQKNEQIILRNTCLSSLRQSVSSIARGKGQLSRAQAALAVAIYPGIIEHIMALVLYCAAWFTPIISPIVKILIAVFLPILRKLKKY